MSIVKYDLKTTGRSVKQRFEGQYVTTTTIVNGGESVYRRTTPLVKTSGQVIYIVEVDRKDESPISILQDIRLPQLGANYVENGVVFWNVYYVEATPRFIGPVGSYFQWEITYTLGGDFSNAPQNETGENETTLLSFSANIELEDVAGAVDLNGQWNANSIGDMFLDPLIYKNGILVLNYSRREYDNPLGLVRDYFQKVNSAAWYSFSAGTVKADNISFSATQTTNQTYYDVNYTLKYKPTGWTVNKANSGLYYMSSGTKHRALNPDGSPTDTPILLALDGSILPSGGTVPMKAFVVHAGADFSGLDLPDPFSL